MTKEKKGRATAKVQLELGTKSRKKKKVDRSPNQSPFGRPVLMQN